MISLIVSYENITKKLQFRNLWGKTSYTMLELHLNEKRPLMRPL